MKKYSIRNKAKKCRTGILACRVRQEWSDLQDEKEEVYEDLYTD